ncbi:PASTA domain-containing protein [Gordonia rhizosphera]|nr:PASTA domain-containing protein [Gordonia rhizosphera]
MPDTRGMSESAARQLLIDAGLTPSAIETSTEPAAGPVGTVIDQTPASGTENPAKASLVLSSEATMPNFAGRNGQQLAVDLQKLGAQVEVVSQYRPGSRPGTVISSDPRPGASLPSSVRLTVAQPGSSVYLAKLSAISSSCSSGKYSLNGKDFDNSTACSSSSDGNAQYEWLTNRVADQLTASVGISDEDTPGTAVRVDVLADGRPVGHVVARYGSTSELNAIVTGALRVTLVVTRLSPGDDSVSVVLGDARLIGNADAIDRLTE